MTSLSDRDIVALTLYGEARGEPLDGKLAVASVLRNRLRDGRWGRTYESVCLKPKQFSCWNASDPNHRVLMQMAAALGRGEQIDDPTYRTCEWIADGLMWNVFESNVGKSTHYFAKRMKDPPKWAAAGEFVVTIAGHHFLENVA
jgi:N-acetylmuramoyl-L-alanine amidase